MEEITFDPSRLAEPAYVQALCDELRPLGLKARLRKIFIQTCGRWSEGELRGLRRALALGGDPSQYGLSPAEAAALRPDVEFDLLQADRLIAHTSAASVAEALAALLA